MINLFNNLYLFAKCKKIFLPPAEKKILLFDKITENIFFTKINKEKYEVLSIRKEEINIWVLLKAILSLKINLENYTYHYISYVKYHY